VLSGPSSAGPCCSLRLHRVCSEAQEDAGSDVCLVFWSSVDDSERLRATDEDGRTIGHKGSAPLKMSSAKEVGMEGNHFHVFVRDLPRALDWFAQVWAAEPTYRGERMAVLQFGPILLVLDQGEDETITTIGYATTDCDADFRTVVGRGAQVIEEPADRGWGVRVAYLKGPGHITLELEQELSRANARSSESAT
jgi:predicted enzyme related to lactoylglutathione lyase